MGENICKWNDWQGIDLQNIQTAHPTQCTKNKKIKKWMEYQNRHFFKEDIQIAKRYMKRCSIALIIRETQIKTIIRYHLTQMRMTIIKNSINNKCCRGCGEKGTLLHCWWAFKLVQLLWRMGFPDGTSGKELTCQCRRHKRCGFDPWVGKIPWRRAWQSTPVFFPGESHGQRSVVSYSPQDRKES